LDLINAACGKTNTRLLIVGDFNFPEVDWESWTSSSSNLHASSKFLDCLQDNYLSQVVSCYTRYREGQKPSLLDLVIVNEEQLVDDVTDYNPIGKSDHVVLQFELNCYKATIENQSARFVYAKGDYTRLCEDLSQVNWTRLEDLDVTNAWDYLVDNIRKAMDKHIPKSKPFNAAL
jgi:hypothetical protein